ncbi:hypothetical protein MTO96_029274 [Rhipicephalus appendiculatus]
MKIAFSLGMRVIVLSEQVPSYEYIHADADADSEHVSPLTSTLVEDIPLLMSGCFSHGDNPCGITEFLQYVPSMKLEGTPGYKTLKMIFENIQAAGSKRDSRLFVTPPRTPMCKSFSPRKPVLHGIILGEESTRKSGNEIVAEKPPPPRSPTDARHRSRGATAGTAATRPKSGLHGLVNLEPDRNPVKKETISFLSYMPSSKVSKEQLLRGLQQHGPGNTATAVLLLSGGNGRTLSSTSPSANCFQSALCRDCRFSPSQAYNCGVRADNPNAPRPVKNNRTVRKRRVYAPPAVTPSDTMLHERSTTKKVVFTSESKRCKWFSSY